MNPETLVALVHAAGLDHHNWGLPNEQGRLHVEAACKLYMQGDLSKIVFTGGEYKRGQISMGDAMQFYAFTQLPDSAFSDVLSRPIGVTTRAEIRVFHQMAIENSWNNLLDISTADQLIRIRRRLLIEFGREIPTLSVEGILGMELPNQSGVGLRENILNKIDESPAGVLLNWVARKIPSKCYIEELTTDVLSKLN